MKKRVYLSSTERDLRDYRRVAIRSIQQRGCDVVAMELYSAGPIRPLEKCLEDVRNSDLYVGLVGWRAGRRPPKHQVAFTQLEYEEAMRSNVPCLVFVLDESYPWPPEYRDSDSTAIKRFREAVRERHLTASFTSPESLDAELTRALANWLEREYRSPAVPALLPYMQDRSEQAAALREFVQEHGAARPHRPAVVLVYGHVDEAHDAFVQRMQQCNLPELLQLKTNWGRMDLVTVRWSQRLGSVAEQYEEVRRNLADALIGDRSAPESVIAEAIARRRCSVMLYTTAHLTRWDRENAELLRRWIRCWDEWPDLLGDQWVFVVHCMKQVELNRASWLGRTRAAMQARRMRRHLDAFDFARYAHLSICALPELRSINEADTIAWIDEELGAFCKENGLSALTVAEHLRSKTATLFDGWNSRGIPAQTLAHELRGLLGDALMARGEGR